MAKYQTNQRKILLDYLSHNVDKPLSAQMIAEKLDSLSLSAVYRNLTDLEKSGVVQKSINPIDRKAYYRYLNRPVCCEHIHLSCTNCGKVFHMEDENSKILIDHLFRFEQFAVNKTETILYGLCKDCSL